MPRKAIEYLDRTFYPDHIDRWDDQLLRKEVIRLIKPEFSILDVGAGRGRIKEMNFKGLVSKVVGVDPDPRVADNPLLDQGFVGLGDRMPFFDDCSFDLVFCDNVLEHVEQPLSFYKEVSRVLKPGGYFVSKTPNRFYYVSLIAAMTPDWFHKYVNKKRGRIESDTFTTFYRANTPMAQKKWAKMSGLVVVECNSVEGRPEYLRIFALSYLVGIVFERMVNLFRLNALKAILITVYQKPAH